MTTYPELLSREWLHEHHIQQGLNQSQIARLVGCSIVGARSALIRHGLYRPKRRPQERRVLAHVDQSRMLADAAQVSSWLMLAHGYGCGRSVVQDHALFLEIQDEVAACFRPIDRSTPLEPHPYLESRDWIARTWWNRSYRMSEVCLVAGVTPYVLRRWLQAHRMSGAELRAARDAAIVVEYVSGEMMRDVADSHKMDPAAVFRILRAADVDTSARKVQFARQWRQSLPCPPSGGQTPERV